MQMIEGTFLQILRDTKRMEYYENWYANWFDNLDEMVKLIEAYNLPKLTQEEI